MSLTTIGFPSGANLENEDLLMTTASAATYGQLMCVDRINVSTDSPPRFTKMIPVGAVPFTNFIAARAVWYGVCQEPLGIAAGGTGRFRFIGEIAAGQVASMAQINSLDCVLVANHGHTNTTHASTEASATVSASRAIWAIGTGVSVTSGTIIPGVSLLVGQKIIGYPLISATVNSASTTRIPYMLNGIQGFGVFAI